MAGYCGTFLRVNLNTGKISKVIADCQENSPFLAWSSALTRRNMQECCSQGSNRSGYFGYRSRQGGVYTETIFAPPISSE